MHLDAVISCNCSVVTSYGFERISLEKMNAGSVGVELKSTLSRRC